LNFKVLDLFAEIFETVWTLYRSYNSRHYTIPNSGLYIITTKVC